MIDAILTNTILPRLSEEYLRRTIAGQALAKITIGVAGTDFAYSFE
jgi:type VI secretion system protein VasG